MQRSRHSVALMEKHIEEAEIAPGRLVAFGTMRTKNSGSRCISGGSETPAHAGGSQALWHEVPGQHQHPAGSGRGTHVPGDVSVGCAQDLLIPAASWGRTMWGKRRDMQKGDEGHNRVHFTERGVPSAALCATAQ